MTLKSNPISKARFSAYANIAIIAAFFCLVAGCSASASKFAHLSPATRTTAKAFQAHVEYLADDDLEGRGLGSKGIDLAANYIANQFREIGLQPAANDGTYFQPFQATLSARLANGGTMTIKQSGTTLKQGTDFLPFPFSSTDQFEGSVVFAGYGIINEEKDHNDYADLDVSGKIALILRGAPATWTTATPADMTQAGLRNKVYNAKDNGALAILIVNPTEKTDEKQPDKLISWNELAGEESLGDYGLPAMHLTRAAANKILAAASSMPIEALQSRIEAGGPASAEFKGITLAAKPALSRDRISTDNIVAILPGEGLLASEVLVIGAHYDHLGIVVPRTTFNSTGKPVPQIHNGADDNASGTAGVIELARMFAAQKQKPKRSIMFVAFSGEESGLLGSKHFMKNPPIDPKQMVAMINMDMIGRLRPKDRTVQIFGTQSATEFEPMLKKLCEEHNLTLKGSAGGFGASDHTSFYVKDIPAVHVFTGLHGDYHLPSDDADKINAAGAAEILELVRDMADEILNTDARPTFQKVKGQAGETSRKHFRVRIGIMPSFADDGTGLGVDGVSPGGPAEAAGIKGGDIIIREGGTEVKNIHDHMGALRKFKPGDVVDVVVIRDGAEKTFKVTLAGSKKK